VALRDNAQDLAEVVQAQDVVFLHDPQTAGLVAAIKETGATDGFLGARSLLDYLELVRRLLR
jgi:hypothetical protein